MNLFKEKVAHTLFCFSLLFASVANASITIDISDVHAECDKGLGSIGIKACLEAIENESNNLRAYVRRANLFFEQGDFQLAVKECDEIINRFLERGMGISEFSDIYALRASSHYYLNSYKEVIADINYLLELRSNRIDPIPYFLRGMSYAELGQLNQAIDDFSQAILLNGSDSDFYHERANSYRERGDFAHSLSDFKELVRLNPSRHNYNDLGAAYSLVWKNNLALQAYDIALKYEGDDSFTLTQIGITHYSNGDYKKAVRSFKKALKKNQSYEYNYLRLIIASKKNNESSYNRLEKYVNKHESQEWVRKISLYYLGLDDLTEADVLREASQEKDKKARSEKLCEAYYYLAEKRLMGGDKKGAIEFFEKSMDTNVFYYRENFLSRSIVTRLTNRN